MNIIEAIKSGRPFKRPSDRDWVDPGFEHTGRISRENLVAEDWELKKPEPVSFKVVMKSVSSHGDPTLQIPRLEFTLCVLGRYPAHAYPRLREIFDSRKEFTVTL